MAAIRIITSYRHKVGKLKDLKAWLAVSGHTMLAASCGPHERYVGVYMIEGDPSYTIEVHTLTDDPGVIEDLDQLNTPQFERGQTAMRLMWRFLDPTFPPRVRYARALHEAAPR